MSLTSIAKRVGSASRRVVAAITSTALAATVMVGGAGTAAAADNRANLRPDATGTCEWAPAAYWVQDCDVFSPSMGTNVRVQIQPAKNGGHAGLYLLDGADAPTPSAWIQNINIQKIYVDSNVTLVVPNGGSNSFYKDWVGNPKFQLGVTQPLKYKWETFLTQELPPYLQANFGVNPSTNSVMGFSMGGNAALTLTETHGNQFQQVLALSPGPFETIPGNNLGFSIAWASRGGYNFNAIYGSLINPRRFAEDPALNIGRLRGKSVYVSAASGVATAEELLMGPEVVAVGGAIEMGSNIETRAFETVARASGVNLQVDYPAQGIHNFPLWISQANKTKPLILNHLNGW